MTQTDDSSPTARPMAACGRCTVHGDTIARDSECPAHGLDADPAWWRTPARLRERDADTMPEAPRMTRREAEDDRRRLEGGGRYGR